MLKKCEISIINMWFLFKKKNKNGGGWKKDYGKFLYF